MITFICVSVFLRKVCGIEHSGLSEAIAIARDFKGRQRNFTGEHFWVRGYFVSTVGLDEKIALEYIRNQEKADEQQKQLRLGRLL